MEDLEDMDKKNFYSIQILLGRKCEDLKKGICSNQRVGNP